MKKNWKQIVCETEKPKLLQNLEMVYKGDLWEPRRAFEVQEKDLHLVFDMINDGMFGNRLGRGVAKVVLKAEAIPTGPMKYRSMQGALAAFAAGQAKGDPQELIMVSYRGRLNFFDIACALMHEMIHMYDFEFGPMGEQFRKYGAIAVYNFNYPIMDPRSGRPVLPRNGLEQSMANAANAAAAGFKSVEQLPDELRAKMKNPGLNDGRPRQYQVPGQVVGSHTWPDTGERHVLTRPIPAKFQMGVPDGLYDVHGQFFQNWAQKFNDMGFSVCDVID